MKDNLHFNIDGFDTMYRIAKRVFNDNLLAIFVHGSLFDGTFDKNSDYDIVVILEHHTHEVLKRDLLAQKLKRLLYGKWNDNPYSFDFFTKDELFESAQEGHPFLRSILTKGSPVYDPGALFSSAKYKLNSKLSAKMKMRMMKNLIVLSIMHYNAAVILGGMRDVTYLATEEALKAVVLLLRAKMIKKNKHIYKGELFQYFIKEYGHNIDSRTIGMMWKYLFHANQIAFRYMEPHVDIPIQNVEENLRTIQKIDYTEKLLEIYNKIIPL